MTAAELFRRGLRDHRRALAVWCLGIAGYVALVLFDLLFVLDPPGARQLGRASCREIV